MPWCVTHLKRRGVQVQGWRKVAGDWFCLECWRGKDVKTRSLVKVKPRTVLGYLTPEERSWATINRQVLEFRKRKI